eukprot:Transcript_290.p1 GENE.Transcript_290~~Transcript_290.p1  ORF type:complete len:890 (-),score=103.24 Transcript_290:238-2907(-)
MRIDLRFLLLAALVAVIIDIVYEKTHQCNGKKPMNLAEPADLQRVDSASCLFGLANGECPESYRTLQPDLRWIYETPKALATLKKIGLARLVCAYNMMHFIKRTPHLQAVGLRVLDVSGAPQYVSMLNQPNVTVTRGDTFDIHRTHFPSASFDVILLEMVIEHLAKPWAALREIRRLLAKGGTVVLTTAFHYPLHGSTAHFTDRYRFTVDGLLGLATPDVFAPSEVELLGGWGSPEYSNMKLSIGGSTMKLLKQAEKTFLASVVGGESLEAKVAWIRKSWDPARTQEDALTTWVALRKTSAHQPRRWSASHDGRRPWAPQRSFQHMHKRHTTQAMGDDKAWRDMLTSVPHRAIPGHSTDDAQASSVNLTRSFSSYAEYDYFAEWLLAEILKPAAAYHDLEPPDGPYHGAGLTMGNARLLRGLRKQLEDLADRGIAGDVIETGTWRAGTAAFMVGVLTAYERLQALKQGSPQRLRHFWFFDSFEGFAKGQGLEVGKQMEMQLVRNIYAAPLNRVLDTFATLGLLASNVHFIKGFFEQTMPALGGTPRPVALLRLDGDLYSSTEVVLRHFYPRVAEGGWTVIDDYDWHPDEPGVCRRAVNEYRAHFSITSPITREFGRPSWRRVGAAESGLPAAPEASEPLSVPSPWASRPEPSGGHERCAAMQELATQAEQLGRLHLWEELKCTKPLGFRPKAHVPRLVGTPCEPWIHRSAQFVLSRLLSKRMSALEWSTGSSTRYFLLWVASLHSVEHDVRWSAEVESSLRNELPGDLTRRWRLDRVSNSTPYKTGLRGYDEPLAAFRAYVQVPLDRRNYDFVSVDGRARSACLDRVFQEGLVRKGGGILMLDNSLRPQYKAARRRFDESAEYVRVEFNASNSGDAGLDEVGTALWCRL